MCSMSIIYQKVYFLDLLHPYLDLIFEKKIHKFPQVENFKKECNCRIFLDFVGTKTIFFPCLYNGVAFHLQVMTC